MNLAESGDNGDYNMKTWREQNLRLCSKARYYEVDSRWIPGPDLWRRGAFLIITLMLQACFCQRTKLCECQRGWTTRLQYKMLYKILNNFFRDWYDTIWISIFASYISASPRLMWQTKQIMRNKTRDLLTRLDWKFYVVEWSIFMWLIWSRCSQRSLWFW